MNNAENQNPYTKSESTPRR